ncbi:MAG: cyclic nucleotide-binding domain-containing protein [Syntrophales bacterium]|nr:cyclic nucleotide-binding domain-containing protein [Syntrophales bacterium]NLN60599.1 cyclic nucleotide-binding domain-containing protein [Deltaproteobacteria bacterium]
MFQIASYETFQDGQVIFQEGTHGDWIYVIEEGAVEISKEMKGRRVVVEVLPPGEIFGEMAFISKMPRTATATAMGETTVGIVNRDYYDHEFNRMPEDFRQVFNTIAARLKKATDAIIAAAIQED